MLGILTCQFSENCLPSMVSNVSPDQCNGLFHRLEIFYMRSRIWANRQTIFPWPHSVVVAWPFVVYLIRLLMVAVAVLPSICRNTCRANNPWLGKSTWIENAQLAQIGAMGLGSWDAHNAHTNVVLFEVRTDGGRQPTFVSSHNQFVHEQFSIVLQLNMTSV